jgi:taurine dioxygenase
MGRKQQANADACVNSAPEVKRVGAFLGAEVMGVDLTRPLDAAAVDTIRLAHAEHGVLVFPDQEISSEDLMRFGRYFGELSVHPFSTSTEETPELIVYDNKEGNPPLSTNIWHTDETFRECPPMGTILCSKIVPGTGGDTEFANMGAVYEGLSDRIQQYISGLEAVHDLGPFRTLFDDSDEGRRQLRKYEDIYPAVTHPVVRVHPVSGRKVIFVNPQFTLHIKGMEDDESRTLLGYLYRRTLIHEYHYRHNWQPDTVVFWDNCLVQHSALHDYYPQRRKMERVTIAGSRPVGDAPAADPSELRRYIMPPPSAFEDTRKKRLHERD